MLIFSFLFLSIAVFSSVLSSQIQADSSSTFNAANFIKNYLQEHFISEIFYHVQGNEKIVTALVNIVEEINDNFLKDQIIDEGIYILIKNCFREKVKVLQFETKIEGDVDGYGEGEGEGSQIAQKLIQSLELTCRNCESELFTIRVAQEFYDIQIAENKNKLETMADICHLFKIPVQRLILSSELMDIGELFKNASVLLENIRLIFLFKIDPKAPFYFIYHLNFIRNSFDMYIITDCDPQNHLFNLYNQLKMKFKIQIDSIFVRLSKSKDPFTEFKNGSGQQSINIISFASYPNNLMMPSDKELWTFIMYKIDLLRDEINDCCPDIKEFIDSSVIDLILVGIAEKRINNEQFSLKEACISIKSSFDSYISILILIGSYKMDSGVESIISQMNYILDASIRKFNDDLEMKINEIQNRFDYFESDSKFLFSRIAIAELLREHENHLEGQFI